MPAGLSVAGHIIIDAEKAKTPARCCVRWGLVRTHTARAPGGFGSLRRPAFVEFERDRFRKLYQIAHSKAAVEKWDNTTRRWDETA
jgi:hypothetical protein